MESEILTPDSNKMHITVYTTYAQIMTFFCGRYAVLQLSIQKFDKGISLLVILYFQ